jgi:hypothetical protein
MLSNSGVVISKENSHIPTPLRSGLNFAENWTSVDRAMQVCSSLKKLSA